MWYADEADTHSLIFTSVLDHVTEPSFKCRTQMKTHFQSSWGGKAVGKIKVEYLAFDNIYVRLLDSSKIWKLFIVMLSPKRK